MTETKFMFIAAEKGKILHITELSGFKEEFTTLCGRTQKGDTGYWYDYYEVKSYPFERELCSRCTAIQNPGPILAQMRIERAEYQGKVEAEQKERDARSARRRMLQAEVSAKLESGLKELFSQLDLLILGRKGESDLTAIRETPYGEIFYGVRIEEFSKPYWYGASYLEQRQEVRRIVKLSETGGEK